jgi:hypothetical protein
LVAGPTGRQFTESLLLASTPHSDIFQNGEDRSLAVALDRVRRKGRLVVRVPGLSRRHQDAG